MAEGLNCMAMYAMGVESSAEVLTYLNRALDICAHNGAVNGCVFLFLFFFFLLVELLLI